MESINAESPSALPETLGRYRLLEPLGQGGMGAVFLAHDTKLDRRVAVKVLPPHTINDPGAVARFQREAKALAKLGHPGIVQAFDSDSAGDRHFLVMEYVEGENLAALLKKNGPLPPTIAADYIHQAALALQHAHEKGLIHRDIKPSNLLVTAERRIKLLDLGLARFVQDQIADPGLTREGAGMGTPDYAAPEQFANAHQADVRSDIYSLGCTLYHLVAGQAPFPGSSWEEKYQAHQHREPPPLADLCPTAPAGLFFAVEKMMAKRPEDRFQTAQEAAEALAPCVAGSSVTLEAAKQTMTYLRTQAALRMRPARRWPWALAGAALSGALLLVSLFAWPGWWPESASSDDKIGQVGPEDSGGDKRGDKKDKDVKDGKKGKKDDHKKQHPPPVWDDPDILTVAQDGSAKFKTIGNALAAVTEKGPKTIRVLDDKEYRENVSIRIPGLHRGLTLEAPRGALLVGTLKGSGALRVINVQDVTVRGFRLRTTDPALSAVDIWGRSAGLTLEDLTFDSGDGIFCSEPEVLDGEAPIIIQRCMFSQSRVGLFIQGFSSQTFKETKAAGVVVRNNRMDNPVAGINLFGRLHNVQIVGNVISGASLDAINFDQVSAASKLLVANNTLKDCVRGLVVLAADPKGTSIRLCNNLLLGCSEEDVGLRVPGRKFGDPGIRHGDGRLLAAAWHLSHNWCELPSPPAEDSAAFKGLAPIEGSNKRVKEIKGILSRDPKSPEYLRPAAESPLAKDGAGNDDPSLPTYIGALPPPGQPAWDWTRTWQAWPPGRMLTVSKEPKDKGKYRTIHAALDAAKPWDTIRVLDGKTYTERIVLDDQRRHEGIALEAPFGATIAMSGKDVQPWIIKNVSQVRIRGFHFRCSNPTIAFTPCLMVAGQSPGVVVEALHVRMEGQMDGIRLANCHTPEGRAPVIIRGCHIQGGARSILLLGPPEAVKQQPATAGIVVDGNRLTGALIGLLVSGQAARAQVTANRMWDCGLAGMEVEDLGNHSSHLFFANNTVLDSGSCFRVWNNAKGTPRRGQVVLAANLLVNVADGADISCFEAKGQDKGAGSSELAEAVSGAWGFAGNWRDLSTNWTAGTVPLSVGDYKLELARFLARDPAHADFMRPDEGMWKAMAKHTPPPGVRRPAYAGAMPPPGVEPWHWEQYWRFKIDSKIRSE